MEPQNKKMIIMVIFMMITVSLLALELIELMSDPGKMPNRNFFILTKKLTSLLIHKNETHLKLYQINSSEFEKLFHREVE